jgi:hypothetical protein
MSEPRIRFVNLNPQPEVVVIPGYRLSPILPAAGGYGARYECMPQSRPIEIRQGRVIIHNHPNGRPGCISPLTLDSPAPGPSSMSGNDEAILRILSLAPFAHTVTTPPGAIAGTKSRIIFDPAVGAWIELLAHGGLWHVLGTNHVFVS